MSEENVVFNLGLRCRASPRVVWVGFNSKFRSVALSVLFEEVVFLRWAMPTAMFFWAFSPFLAYPITA